ncbi:integration host factor, actinobacterial type [Arthrobacter sp. FW306-2-2C-D06B]|uniref:integration host factor, actinobacterial type n=1 Tax=Arthrobacter sp. FW306-2-2C-D06B TaxID=2879618 RepID=UPI001F2162F1|nr:integration host factor, actinobacterial type [Arthrobacter sp. FW306-2-2C-D06B]UKA56905.1 DNA-binding protein [Arthrobacter sp. FW306-2-2C-D06B]
MTLKALSPEERSDALEKAARARARRALAKEQLRTGELSFARLIKSAQTDEAIARMRVSELIEAVPGIGPVRAAAIMTEIGIAASRRLRGLGIHQSRSLIDFMEDKYGV